MSYFTKTGQLDFEYKINGKHTKSYTPIKPESIKPWMTFNYINVVFKLEPTYLKNILNINDKRYPDIRIDNYSRRLNKDQTSTIKEIEKAITNQYQNK